MPAPMISTPCRPVTCRTVSRSKHKLGNHPRRWIDRNEYGRTQQTTNRETTPPQHRACVEPISESSRNPSIPLGPVSAMRNPVLLRYDVCSASMCYHVRALGSAMVPLQTPRKNKQSFPTRPREKPDGYCGLRLVGTVVVHKIQNKPGTSPRAPMDHIRRFTMNTFSPPFPSPRKHEPPIPPLATGTRFFTPTSLP